MFRGSAARIAEHVSEALTQYRGRIVDTLNNSAIGPSVAFIPIVMPQQAQVRPLAAPGAVPPTNKPQSLHHRPGLSVHTAHASPAPIRAETGTFAAPTWYQG